MVTSTKRAAVLVHGRILASYWWLAGRAVTIPIHNSRKTPLEYANWARIPSLSAYLRTIHNTLLPYLQYKRTYRDKPFHWKAKDDCLSKSLGSRSLNDLYIQTLNFSTYSISKHFHLRYSIPQLCLRLGTVLHSLDPKQALSLNVLPYLLCYLLYFFL